MAEGVDALVLATEWNEFKQLDFKRIKGLMKQPIILDGRNLWDAESLALAWIHLLLASDVAI